MSEFGGHFTLGWEHIADINGYDHMVFLLALCALYRIKSWKKVAVLATAFTIGHSLTLALSSLDLIRFPSDLVEMLIPVTIILTSIFNIVKPEENVESKTFSMIMWRNYSIAAGFGLIHGMGFSTYFRHLSIGDESFLSNLFAFNLGIEVGQLMIVAVILGVGYVVMDLLKMKQIRWVHFVSGMSAGIGAIILLEKLLE